MAFTNFIKQIKDTGGTTHDLVDTSASHYVKGTQSASTNVWTGALPDGVTDYYDGLSIDYFLPYAGTSTAATLNLGGKGAKPVYYGNGAGGVTTHYPQYSVIHLTYVVNSGLNSGNGCWKATGYYDTNDTGYYHRRIYSNIKTGANKIFPYTLIMERSDGRWESIVTSSSTGTSKARNANGFRPGHVLLMYYNETYTENQVVSTYRLWSAYTSLIDHRYSFNTANDSTNGLTANLPVYLVGTISTDGLFYLDSTKWWTQTLPSSEDGKVYIYIGQAYDYYRMMFTEEKPMYRYLDGAIREYTDSAGYAKKAGDAATVNGKTVGVNVPSDAVFTDGTVSTLTLASGSTAGTSLAYGGKYTLTAGSKTVSFTMPSSDNTNYYHKTGSWNNLTYTAGKVGSPDDLAFTIPTGTSASTVALGNHTHDYSSTYAAKSHDHSQIITVGDKRSEATTPNSYSNKIIFQGLKSKATIGSPSTDTYSYLVGLRGWSDSSGGNSHEFAFNDSGINWRTGATTAWGTWYKLLSTKDLNSTTSVGTIGSNKVYAVGVDSNGKLAVSVPWTDTDTNTDTKNTAGSTDTSSKIFLIGATSQADNPQTYSHDTAYVGTDGCLYSGGSKVLTGITSSQVTTALGYTPYNSTNPNGYTSNAGTITKIQTSAGAHTTVNVSSGAASFNVPTTAAHVGAVPFLGNLTSIGSGTPAAATQTYWTDNVANTSVSAAYNTSGAEYTLLFSRGGSNSYGSILKYGYTDTYLRILRRNAGNWSSTDWEKISAGYADSAGSVAWDNVTGKPTIPTVSYPVTSVNNKTGAVSLTASDVGALASSTTYVSTVTTTAGTHSAISSKSGAVSFNVPTKTSHLTNDSGFITASHTSTYSLPLAASGTRGGVQIGYTQSGKNYPVQLSNEKMYVNVPWTDTNTEVSTLTLASGSTAGTSLAYGGKYTLTAGSKTVSFTMPASDNTNTTYALSGALSSHKFTSTLTAGGSGSGTSTSDFTLAAGTGISITDTASSRTMTIACTVTNTDTKVTQAYSTATTQHPLLFSATAGISSTSTRGDTTAILNNSIYAVPSTGVINASDFSIGGNSVSESLASLAQIESDADHLVHYIDALPASNSENTTTITGVYDDFDTSPIIELTSSTINLAYGSSGYAGIESDGFHLYHGIIDDTDNELKVGSLKIYPLNGGLAIATV